MRLIAAALTAALTVPSFAQPLDPPDRKTESVLASGQPKRTFAPKESPASAELNLKVSFKVRYKKLESAGNFTVRSGTQANYVLGGEDPVEVTGAKGNKGIELKRHGTIVNILPVVLREGDKVDSQIQVEISGLQAPETSLKVNPITTFQLQTEFTVALGKTFVLVDEPDRRVEVRIETVP